jgi:hypothetical protein
MGPTESEHPAGLRFPRRTRCRRTPVLKIHGYRRLSRVASPTIFSASSNTIRRWTPIARGRRDICTRIDGMVWLAWICPISVPAPARRTHPGQSVVVLRVCPQCEQEPGDHTPASLVVAAENIETHRRSIGDCAGQWRVELILLISNPACQKLMSRSRARRRTPSTEIGGSSAATQRDRSFHPGRAARPKCHVCAAAPRAGREVRRRQIGSPGRLICRPSREHRAA